MPAANIAEVTSTSDDRVRNVIHNLNTDGFDSLYPKYSGGRPRRSRSPSGARSRRTPSSSRPSMTCHFQPAA
nr:helix-turn-helix domain-containing protein [Streptomyces chartreusis]